MGDRFVTEDNTYVLQASLGGGFATVLTVMRAFSQVTSIEIPVDGDTITRAVPRVHPPITTSCSRRTGT